MLSIHICPLKPPGTKPWGMGTYQTQNLLFQYCVSLFALVGSLCPHRAVREGFLEEEMSDIRLEGTIGVHQVKIGKRVLGRRDRGVQRLERIIQLDWSVIERDGRNF